MPANYWHKSNPPEQVDEAAPNRGIKLGFARLPGEKQVLTNVPLRRPSKAQRRRERERQFAVISLLIVAAAWIVGSMRAKADLMPAVEQALPTAGHFENVNNGLFEAYVDSSMAQLVGYVAVAEAHGYGGPLTLAVAVTPSGEVDGLVIADHKETPTWMDRVSDADFIEQLIGKRYADEFSLGSDLDVVTGATYTSAAMAEAALRGSRTVAEHLGLEVTQTVSPKIIFGLPEIILIVLYAAGFMSQRRTFKYKRQLRWVTLLTGLIVLGFIYNKPLTLSMINQVLLGYLPQWQNNLYWFLLIGGIIFVFTVDNKNPYCEFFCPFGAAQECMAVIGGAKNVTLGKHKETWKWVHRGLTWLAIIIALIFRNPGISSYEIFGTLFKLVGNGTQFILLGLVLLVALFVKRPWCHFLCPLHPVEEFIRVIRKWIKETWQNREAKASV